MNKLDKLSVENQEYKQLLSEVKAKVKSAHIAALRSVNHHLIQLYWDIGHLILQKQQEQGWGKSVVKMLAHELQLEFPGAFGFSEASLWRMRNFYMTYQDNVKLAQLVREVGWSHNIIIMERCKDNLSREYYLQMTKRNGWPRESLANCIKNQSYEKFLLSQTNFSKTLPPARQNDARLAIKDEYTFSFLDLEDDHLEKELERGLTNNICKFLIEMGKYFTFVANQHRIEIDGEEYFIDLLLYHRKLRCLIAIELKKGKFQPEHAGKMQFYLSALDDNVRLAEENPSIGIIICQEKSRTKVEYILRDVSKPRGVATYNTSQVLPKEIQEMLPSPEEIAKHLCIFEERGSDIDFYGLSNLKRAN
jgi:predicted nuclease of restriction endonuclease-like (RecB) superfamily